MGVGHHNNCAQSFLYGIFLKFHYYVGGGHLYAGSAYILA